MNRAIQIACVAVVFGALGSAAMADVTIDTVTVGNANNAADTRYETPGYGAVSYPYKIGKYEVTAGQYCEFLNAVAATDTHGLYDERMDSDSRGCQITQHGDSGNYTYDFSGGTVEVPGSTVSDWANRPVNYVSWYDAIRFANWMTAGTTESGSYTITNGGVDSGTVAIPNHATLAAGTTTKWLLTSEDEWYKAAYYDPSLNAGAGGYHAYPTSSDSVPSNDLVKPTDPGNNATFYDFGHTIGSPYYRTEVGEHENSDSPYGTFDQGGNVWEWNEAIIGSHRVLRGGPYGGSGSDLHASFRYTYGPSIELRSFGFRVSASQPFTFKLNGTWVIDSELRALITPLLAPGDTVSGQGTLDGVFTGAAASAVVADDGDMTLGDPGSFAGFSTEGTIDTRANTVTLRSAGFASLGILTTLGGGTLVAPNGVTLGIGDNLFGAGMVNAKIAAGFGSTIAATGNLSVGDGTSYAGFYNDGELLTGAHMVTIDDANEAVLGSLTQLGDGSNGGTLTAGNAAPTDTHAHFLLEQGKNMVGRGFINGNYKNHGHVIGDGIAPSERIVFESGWTVTGKGMFEYVGFKGTFAPGDSPTITSTTHAWYADATVQVELGGTSPGSGNDNHDQINDTATVWLDHDEPPTLEILPWSNFVPEVGDEFVILTWQESLDGEFGDVIVDSWFTDHGIDFKPHYNNVGGTGNLTIEATPEPATLALLALGGLALVRRRRSC